jgi:DNA-binding winged helix-turn-helix (wHTH) protein/Flp pilus assembly protein TadD
MDSLDHRSVVYAFGPFRLDTVRRLLIAGSRVSALGDKPFQILMLFLESNGRLVERETLIDALWPDEDIGENNLTQHVYLLRKLLEEHGGKSGYIKTESRRGYRFTVPVAAIDNSFDHFSPHIAAALGNLIARNQFDTFRPYCEGCYQLEKRTHLSLLAAASCFSEVVELDPMHWQAHLGAAKAYAFLGAYLYAPSKEVFPKAKAAALRALEIHPSAAGYAQLSEILMFGEWDWSGAEAAMQTALTMAPQSASVHNHAAWLAIGSGDFDRALYEARAALEIEPASLFYRNVLARVLIHRSDNANAISLLSRVLELDPTIDAAIENLALAYTVNGQPDFAVRLLCERSERGMLGDHMTGQLARAHADAGQRREAERVCAELVATYKARYVPAWPIALATVGLNRESEAIEQLSRGAREREAALIFLQRLPLFDALREREEFSSIVTTVGPTH